MTRPGIIELLLDGKAAAAMGRTTSADEAPAMTDGSTLARGRIGCVNGDSDNRAGEVGTTAGYEGGTG